MTQLSGSSDTTEDTSSSCSNLKSSSLLLDQQINSKLIPEGGWGWAICAAAFAVQFVVMGIHNSFGILYTKLLEEYEKSKAETGENHRFSVQVFHTILSP